MAEVETTWEKLRVAVRRAWPESYMPSDPEQMNEVGVCLYALSVEIDELRRRNADLERQLREMAVKR